MSLYSMLNVTVDLKQPANVQGSTGGITQTFSTVASVPAAVQVDNSTAAIEFLRETGRRVMDVYINYPQAAVPVAGWRVTVTSGPYTNVDLEVDSASSDHAGRGTYWHMRCMDVPAEVSA